MSADIFISYSSKEEKEARRVKTVLEDNGFTCWMAPDSIPSGSNYKLQIPEAIENCKAVVFIMSENSQKSVWVQKEVTDAINQQKLVIPYMIQDCPLNKDFRFILSDIQQVPAYKNEETALKNVIQDIRNVIDSSNVDSIRITINKKNADRKWIPAVIAAVLAIAVALVFIIPKMMKPSSSAMLSSSSADVYYSELLPYTKAGYYESFNDTDGIVSDSLNTTRAFSILSFLRNSSDSAAFVENISCDILELIPDESAAVQLDAVIAGSTFKLFAVNNGWGDSKEIPYTVTVEHNAAYPDFPALNASLENSGSFAIEKESAALIGEFEIDTHEAAEWAKNNNASSPFSFATVNIISDHSEEIIYSGYLVYNPEDGSLKLDYNGIGDGTDYSVTLYALLNVDQNPSSIHFTGPDATPLVQDTFRIETVIIPTKSVSLKCQGSYSIQGNIQKTDEYSVHVTVPVFSDGAFGRTGLATKELAAIDMNDTQKVSEILNRYRYDPESILENHLADEE